MFSLSIQTRKLAINTVDVFDLIFLLHFRLSDLRNKYVSIISPTNEPLKYRIVPGERDACRLSLPWTMYIKGKLCYSSLALYVCFVDRCLSFFFWPLCCLFFNLRILITCPSLLLNIFLIS